MPPPVSSFSSSFESQLEQNLKRLVVNGQSILLAVSGGRDSMAMLHGVARLRGILDIPHIVAGHLNHGLRGTAGSKDADLVRSACQSLDVRCVVSECAAGQLERASRGSLEESARTARYEFLKATAQQHGTPLIATAHHAADQVETVLHNIIRGTGLRGLRGIPERRRLSDTAELIRPMLTIKSDEISDYVQLHDIVVASDESNTDRSFARNRIRHELIPLLQNDFNIRIADSLVRLAEQSQELLQGLDTLAETLLMEVLLEQTPDLCRLDISKLRAHSEPILRHTLTVLWIRQSWSRRDMNSAHFLRLTSMLRHSVPPAIDLPGGVRAELRANLLVLRKSPTER
jgi:tRNA(Ile)-lysidine synthase